MRWPDTFLTLTTSSSHSGILHTMKPVSIRIRPGTTADLPQVHHLVCELATYEREPDAVNASIPDYIRDFDHNWFQFLIAETNDSIVGTAIFYYGYSTWKGRMIYLEDLIVTASYRQQGIGTRIFHQLLEMAQNQGIRQIKWQVLAWNEPALAFYAKHKASIETGWWNGRIVLSPSAE